MPKTLIWFAMFLPIYLAICFSAHLALYKTTLELSSYGTMIASISGRIHEPMSQNEIKHLSSQVSKVEFGGDLRSLGVNFDAKPLAYYLKPTTFDMKASLALLNDGSLGFAQVKFDLLFSKISMVYARRLQLLGTLSKIAGAVGLLLLLIFLWQWKRSSGHWSHEISLATDPPLEQDLSSFEDYLQSVVAEEVKLSGHGALLSCKGFDADDIPIKLKEVAELIAEQLVRNSILHGGRPAEQRLLAGKTDYISIRVTIEDQEANWLLSVRDNGEGLNGVDILTTARSLKLVNSATADSLAPEQRIKLVFLPGFTTRDKAYRSLKTTSLCRNYEKSLSVLTALSQFKTSTATIANSQCDSQSHKLIGIGA
jgi:hypothetical protein